MKTGQKILLVDHSSKTLPNAMLELAGYSVDTVNNRTSAIRRIQTAEPDLILITLANASDESLSICAQLRARSALPIIILTDCGDELDSVIGLEKGADDFLIRPFSNRSLLARMKAVLRRSGTRHQYCGVDQSIHYRFSKWLFDTAERCLTKENQNKLSLSTGEFEMLKTLVERPGRVLTREQLMDLSRGRNFCAYDRSIDTQISRLRKKIEDNPKRPSLIKTVWGGGYIFTPQVTRVSKPVFPDWSG